MDHRESLRRAILSFETSCSLQRGTTTALAARVHRAATPSMEDTPHVGTLIYQGDNWPEEYRGHLFTHNLHGHQINHQVNLRDGSDSTRSTADGTCSSAPIRRTSPWTFRPVPDGAVYFIDWYDTLLS